MTDIQRELFAIRDLDYRDFHARLIPTVDKELIIGVRTPELRKYAKMLARSPRAKEFVSELPHKYYEENNVHMALLEQIKDYDTALNEVEKFLPYIDNWATCDMFMPKVFKKHTDELILKLKEWIADGREYVVRYGLGVLMRLYLDGEFKAEYLDLAASVKCGDYYVDMMLAWFFATALAKQYDAAIAYLTEKRLPIWVHNKTIQKAVESSRISAETKKYLRTLKISVKEEGQA